MDKNELSDLSHWNHRIIKRSFPRPDGTVDVLFGIHEVYYDAEGNPNTCTMNPIRIVGDSVDELKRTIDWIRAALKKPILDMEKDFN